jgi:predicted alpha/beta hydrolase
MSTASRDEPGNRAAQATGVASPVDGERVVITTGDGRRLHGTHVAPADARSVAPQMAVVLHGATGVPAGYYSAFAGWLAAEHNAAVLTYDYRDFASSATGHPRASTALMSDWGIHDQGAALTWMARRWPDLPLRVIGHSLGALWLAFHADITRVDRVVGVASGPAYWRNHPLSYMPAVIWFWWLGGPAAVTAMGYMPGSALGLGPNLPAGVYWQWRRWCMRPDFARSDWGSLLPQPDLTRARFALTSVALADDVLIPPNFAARLADFYPSAPSQAQVIVPADHGLSQIGHTGVFTRRCAAAWPAIVRGLVA